MYYILYKMYFELFFSPKKLTEQNVEIHQKG